VDTFESNVLLNLDDVFCVLRFGNEDKKKDSAFWEFLVFFCVRYPAAAFFFLVRERAIERASEHAMALFLPSLRCEFSLSLGMRWDEREE
jgi:hypothetical protein